MLGYLWKSKTFSLEIGIIIPNINSLKGLFKASKNIYDDIYDLYDISLLHTMRSKKRLFKQHGTYSYT